jgi:O-antigen ligase
MPLWLLVLIVNFNRRSYLNLPVYGRFLPVHAWLLPGVLWFLLGIAWASSNKAYQQGLVVFLWLPAIVVSIFSKKLLVSLWVNNRVALSVLFFLTFWAALSTLWTNALEPLREAKRILYVVFFLSGFVLVSGKRPESYIVVLQVAGGCLALAALVALVQGYGWEGKPWHWRLIGIGLLNHPILGGYVTGLAAIWLLLLPPRGFAARLIWGLSLVVMLAFLVMTQSRGLWAAMLAVVFLLPLWRNNRFVWALSVLLLFGVAIGYWQFETLITARGASYRPEIFIASLQMILDNPWLGVGLGGDYRISIVSSGITFDHSHNLLTHVALELGMPGLLAWLFLWGWCLNVTWKARTSRLGGAVLGILIFSSCALLFDGANLWDTPRPEWFLTWLPVALTLGLRSFARQAEPLCYQPHLGINT